MRVQERASAINPGAATNDALALEASRRDGRAMAAIFRGYHQPLYRFCLAIVGNQQDAEDALQETMVKVLRALPDEKRAIVLKPWLYRIAHNESIALLRRRREAAPLTGDEVAVGGALSEQVEARGRLRQLIADLGALPDRQRAVLLMREAAGLDFQEIATALATSVAASRQTLYEARLALRQMDAGRQMACDVVTRELSDGDGRARRRRDIRAHLRTCGGCRLFAEEIDSRHGALAAIAPLPSAAAMAMLRGVIGGGGAGATSAGSGASVGTLVGGSVGKSLGTVTLLKGAASVALIAAIGIGAADKDGLINIASHHAAPKVRSAPKISSTANHAGASRTSRRALRPENAGEPLATSVTRPDEGRLSSRSDRAVASPQAADPKPKEPEARNEAVPTALDPKASEAGAAAPAVAIEPPLPTTPTTSEVAAASPDDSAGEHSSGEGHVKQTPPSADHGQETAASHRPEKNSGPGNSAAAKSSHPGSSEAVAVESPTPEGDSGAPEHPVPPTHPAHPTTPASPATPPTATDSEEIPTAPVAEEPPPETHGKKPDHP
jgi:RNA polymerase sigma factor (sigma-70 family)